MTETSSANKSSESFLHRAMQLDATAYNYELPPERIAAYPLHVRDQSRLLVVSKGLHDSHFYALPHWLDSGTLLVMNNTKVVQARLVFFKESGARIEIFCLSPLYPEQAPDRALALNPPVQWHCLVGNLKKWKEGLLRMTMVDSGIELSARLIEKGDQGCTVEFSWLPESKSFGEILELAGQTPLPPYIHRHAENADRLSYQTVYARHSGSVAAPTAGLHFTPAVFGALREKNIASMELSLHVGAGTFKPITSSQVGEHQMHREQFVVPAPLLQELIDRQSDQSGPLVSVGTTSMRSLESLYWMGLKLIMGQSPDTDVHVLQQWEAYYLADSVYASFPPPKECLQALLDWMNQREQDELRGETSLLISPGYPFQMVDALLTNFHQPRSTLLLLVAAFAGDIWKDAYAHALNAGYRFLSYGDACLFRRHPRS